MNQEPRSEHNADALSKNIIPFSTHPLHDIKRLLIVHTSKNNVLVVQPGGLDRGDEELGAVGVGTRVGHGEEARRGVLDQEVLVVELRSVDRLAPGSVKPLEVSALQHELWDDPVEDRPLVREPLLVLTGRDGSKVGDSSWNDLNIGI